MVLILVKLSRRAHGDTLRLEGWVEPWPPDPHTRSEPPRHAPTILVGRIISSNKNIRNTVVYNVIRPAWTRYGAVRMTEIDEKTRHSNLNPSGTRTR